MHLTKNVFLFVHKKERFFCKANLKELQIFNSAMTNMLTVGLNIRLDVPIQLECWTKWKPLTCVMDCYSRTDIKGQKGLLLHSPLSNPSTAS